MKVSVAYPDALVFKTLFEVLSKMIDEIRLEFDEEGLRIRAVDPSNVGMVDIRYPRESFDVYEVENHGSVGINLATLMKLLKRAKRGNRFELEADDETVELRLQSGYLLKRYRLRNLEVVLPALPEGELSLAARIVMLVEPLSKILKDIQVVGEQVTFEYRKDEEKFLAYSQEQESRYTMELTRESPAVLEMTGDEDARSTYSVDNLVITLQLTKVSESVRLEFSTEAPLRLEFDLPQGGQFVYFLAPYVA